MMKNRSGKLLLLILSMILLTNISISISQAEELAEEEYYEANEIILNDEKLELGRKPIIKHGRTLVPGKELFEKLGFEYKLDEKSETLMANKDDLEMKIILGKSVEGLIYNDIKVDLDLPAMMFKEDLMVPIRGLAEVLDLDLAWDGANKNVVLKENKENKISLKQAHSIIVESEEGRFGKNVNMSFIHTPVWDYNFRDENIVKNNYVFRVVFNNGRFQATYFYCVNKESGEIYLYLEDHTFQLMSDIENSTGVDVSSKELPLELEKTNVFAVIEIIQDQGHSLVTEDMEDLKIVEVGNEENIIGKMNKKEELKKYNLERYGDMYSIYAWVEIFQKIDPEKEYMWIPTIKGEEIRDKLNKISFTNDPRVNEVYINGDYRHIKSREGKMINEFTYSLKNPTLEIAIYDGLNLRNLSLLDVYVIDRKKNKVSEFNGKNILESDGTNTLRSFIDIDLPMEDLGEGSYEVIIEYSGKTLYKKGIYFIE